MIKYLPGMKLITMGNDRPNQSPYGAFIVMDRPGGVGEKIHYTLADGAFHPPLGGTCGETEDFQTQAGARFEAKKLLYHLGFKLNDDNTIQPRPITYGDQQEILREGLAAFRGSDP